MKNSIITQSILTEHVAMIVDAINDGRVTADNFDELHQEVFNTDYFVIGRYRAKQWLETHNIDVFDAIEFVQEYEKANFGEAMADVDSESIVNMFSYIVGEYAVSEVHADTFDQLVENCAEYLL